MASVVNCTPNTNGRKSDTRRKVVLIGDTALDTPEIDSYLTTHGTDVKRVSDFEDAVHWENDADILVIDPSRVPVCSMQVVHYFLETTAALVLLVVGQDASFSLQRILEHNPHVTAISRGVAAPRILEAIDSFTRTRHQQLETITNAS